MKTNRQDTDKGIRHIPTDPQTRERFRGFLLGSADGDALGAPVDFMRRSDIIAEFGEQGIWDYAPAYGPTCSA
jgi:ADP-ribosylglycohydrolase